MILGGLLGVAGRFPPMYMGGVFAGQVNTLNDYFPNKSLKELLALTKYLDQPNANI
jgi:hypothetical protein